VIRVSRWRGGLAGAVLLLAVGLVAGRAAAFAAAAVPLAFAVAAALDSAPTAADLRDDLAVDRRIEPSPAPPGRTVSVEVTVTNEGEETLADCRIVDRVPDELSVTRGTPRAAATLRPGESARIAYETTARRGSFTFEPPALRVRGPTAAAVETAAVPITGDDALECRLDAGDVPTRRRTIDRTGDLTTDEPGAGIEFHSTREYRPGDPVSRIDWKGFAKRGDLATVDFREQRAATMVLVLDARQAAHVVSAPGQPSAVELGAYAATHALDRLLAADHAVGLAVAGDATATPHGGTGTAAIRWIDPGTDRRTRSAVAAALADATDPEQGAHAADPTAIVKRVPRTAQTLVFAPALDDWPADLVAGLAARGGAASVCSPDVVAANTVGGHVEQVRRRARLARCQRLGARVVDWRRQTPLAVALDYALAGAARASQQGTDDGPAVASAAARSEGVGGDGTGEDRAGDDRPASPPPATGSGVGNRRGPTPQGTPDGAAGGDS
jgi:uncharacterized protein (DUF58 family)